MLALTRRFMQIAAIAALCLVCACTLAGCLDSPVLVNYVLDPTSDNIDYDNPRKHYVFDSDASLESQDVADSTDANADEVEEVLYDEPIFSDIEEQTAEQPAPSATYAPAQQSQTTTARQVDAPKAQANRNNATVVSNEEGGAGQNPNATDVGDVGTGKTDPDKDGGWSDTPEEASDPGDGGDDNSGSEANEENDPESEQDAKVTDPGLVYNGRGKIENLPTDLSSVCAVGNAAVVVASIAGIDCLAGADESFVTSGHARKIFGYEALDDVAVCWSGDGSDSGDIDVDAIAACKPSAVLVVTGSQDVSESAQEALRDRGISLVALPAFISDTYIRKAARAVGRLFSDKTDGASEEKASSYDSFVQSTLDAAKATHGGSVSTYEGVDYDNVTDPNPTRNDAGNPANWTALLTEWDDGAHVQASYGGRVLFEEDGAALAQVGWRWSPVSYYLGCGGAVNNAAAYAMYSSESVRLFLNYNENQMSYSWSGLSDKVTLGKDGGTFKQGGTYLLANACDAQGNDAGHCLGSRDFNKVIASTQDIKDKLERARANPLGLYTPGSYQTTPSISGYGIVLDNQLLRSYSTVTDEARGDTLYDIVVNPCGMLGSWTTGSMESFLEAAWAANVFCGYDAESLHDDIVGYYKQFYGYDLSYDENLSRNEIDAILDGSYAR